MPKKRIESNLSNITHKWVDLLISYLSNYSAKLSASELARKSKIPQQTSSRLLNKLVKLNLIEYVIEGKNKMFYFNLKKPTTKIILNLIENQKSLQFQLKQREISVLVNEILNYCESLIVFGSYASSSFNKESDLDIVILGKCDKKQIKKIEQRNIIDINEHYISYNEFAKILKSKNPLSIEIMKNHILFGDVSKIINIFLKEKL